MIEINLIPDVKQELIKAQRIRSKVIMGSIFIGMISIGVVVLLALNIYSVQAFRSFTADNDIKDENSKFSSREDLSKTLTIQNQLTKISDLHSNKKIDSRIFDLLKMIIPPAPNDIKISSLSVNADDSSITIEGQAENSYAAVEVFRKTIEGASVKFTNENDEQQEITIASNVSTSNTSYGEDTTGVKVLRFTISFTYTEELFSPKSRDVSIVITNNGNVTDSYLGIPKSIFTERAQDLVEEVTE